MVTRAWGGIAPQREGVGQGRQSHVHGSHAHSPSSYLHVSWVGHRLPDARPLNVAEQTAAFVPRAGQPGAREPVRAAMASLGNPAGPPRAPGYLFGAEDERFRTTSRVSGARSGT
jgi:hypothetical protein